MTLRVSTFLEYFIKIVIVFWFTVYFLAWRNVILPVV